MSNRRANRAILVSTKRLMRLRASHARRHKGSNHDDSQSRVGHDLPVPGARPFRRRQARRREDRRDTALPRGAKLAVGGAWYHDEAIRRRRRHRSRAKRVALRFACRIRRYRTPKIDQPIRLVSASSAMRPRCELPLASRPGDHTAIDALPGAIARMPPPTPLLPGRPTR